MKTKAPPRPPAPARRADPAHPARAGRPRPPEPHLPHERDERTEPGAVRPDPKMRQAQEDLGSGQVDTDLRSTPGIDAEQRRRLVPIDPKPGK